MSCYLCGKQLEAGEGHRRRVKIGESRSMFRADWHYYYADQIVCDDCARSMDWNRKVIAALIVLLGAIAFYWFKT